MIKKLVAVCIGLSAASSLFSQTAVTTEPARRVVLSAQAQVQVAQDVLTLALQTTRQGYEASTVQSELKSALEAALSVLRKEAVAGQFEVRSGHFGLSPRYDRDGRISAWQGTAELLLEGSDVARITQAAGKVSTLSVGRLQFGLSAAAREQAQAQVQTQAVARFRQRAADLAKGFGAAGYVIDDVQVSYDDTSPQPRPMMMAARAVNDGAPIPAEAGLTTVSVVVSGSVKLQ